MTASKKTSNAKNAKNANKMTAVAVDAITVDAMEIEAQLWVEFEAAAASEEVAAPNASELLTFAMYSDSKSCYVVLRQDNVLEYLYKKNVRGMVKIEGGCLISLDLDPAYVERMNVRSWAFKEGLTQSLPNYARCKAHA